MSEDILYGLERYLVALRSSENIEKSIKETFLDPMIREFC